MKKINELYKIMFSNKDNEQKNKLWFILCNNYLQKYIPKNSVLLEIACGYGEFINNIKAKKKIAIDLNDDAKKYINNDVSFYNSSASVISLNNNSVDVCFSSNFFEHLPNKETLDDVLQESFRVLKPGGVYISIQPNIRYAPSLYWDYYDHIIPLSDKSCTEAFKKSGFIIKKNIPKFLPWSTEVNLPFKCLSLWIYLKLPFLWRFFGKQFLLIAQKPMK